MKIIPANQSELDTYKLMIGSILPRPIAFVSTVSETGVINAAPFSYFNIVCSDPPLISVVPGRKADGSMKDTSRNAVSKGQFIVHVVDEQNVELVNMTSINAPADVSEIELAGLKTVPGDVVDVPRIVESKIAMECTLYRHIEIQSKDGQPSADMLIGEIVCFHIEDDIYDNGRIDESRLKPVSRLAGLKYATVGSVFERSRPVYQRDTQS